MASNTPIYPDNTSSLAYRSPKPTTIDLVGGIYCHICHAIYANKRDYDTHYVNHNTGSKDITYTCVVCHKNIVGYPSFRGHCYTSHVIKDRFKCEHCCKLFSKLTALKEHENAKHRFKCSTCNKEYTTKKELQLHQIIHNNTDMPPFKCQACATQIDTFDDCKEHVDLHSAFIYFCPICNENIPRKDDAVKHLVRHFGENSITELEIQNSIDKDECSIEHLGGISCSFCSQIYKNRVDFDAHFCCEHGDKDIVYTCIACEKNFEKYSVFNDHAYNHYTKGRFSCDICLKTFNRLSLLVIHMSACQADANASGKPFACPYCDHRYVTEMRCREHLRDIHNVYLLTCPEKECNETFTTPKELIFHQRLHRSQENWCRQCGLLFTSLSACERHLDVHKKKLYVCPVCSRNYGERYQILKHLPQHFETVLHICKVCGKVYNAKNRLIEHMKTHSQNKLHTCTYCGKGFVKIAQLQQHINIHTGSKPYKCPICSKTFASYPNWHKHLQRMHKLDGKKYKKTLENVTDYEEESIDNTDNMEEVMVNNDNEQTLANNIVGQNMNEISTDQNVKSTNAELHVGISFEPNPIETYIFHEPDDSSTMESDSIDPIVIEKELQIFENNTVNENNGSIVKFVNVPANATFVNVDTQGSSAPESSQASSAGFPAEYGPEFSPFDAGVGFIDLDDHMLPHIDPLLTIKNEDYPQYMAVNDRTYPHGTTTAYSHTPKWEPPIITKVYSEYSFGYGDMVEANRMSIMNTDIF